MEFNTTQFRAVINQFLADKQIPGAAVRVSSGDTVLFSEGFGHADSARQRPIDEDTIFGIASMSKSITCLALALLEHEGKLSYEDPVCKYLPNFAIPGTPPEAVLIRHLASHTAGLPPLPTLSWSMVWHTEKEDWNAEIIEKIRATAQSHVSSLDDIIDYIQHGHYTILGAPGQYMSYSNDGYALLSSIADKAAGISLEEYVMAHIFKPLGMTRSLFDVDIAKSMGNITSLFSRHQDKEYCSDNWDVAPPYRGCGWVKSTVVDMTRYYMALAQHGMLNGKQIFPATCIERMIGRNFGESVPGVYCYGLNKRLFHNEILCEHSGGLTGVSSKGGFILGKSFAVTMLTNLGGLDCSAVISAAFNLALGLPIETSHYWTTPVATPLADINLYTGEFRSHEDADAFLRIEDGGNGQLTVSNSKESEPLLYCGGNIFTACEHAKVLPEHAVLRLHSWGGKCQMISVGTRIYPRV